MTKPEPYTDAQLEKLRAEHKRHPGAGYCFGCGYKSCRYERWFATIDALKEKLAAAERQLAHDKAQRDYEARLNESW